MGAIVGIILASLLARWSYNMLYVSNNKYWGRMEMQNFYDCAFPVFDTYKQVKIWGKIFKWRVLLEIEPLIYDPKPTSFQKEFYLKVVEQFDALFIQAIPALHQCYDEVKQSIVHHRDQVQPLLILVPLTEEKEWRVYCVTTDNLAFILFFKGYSFERVTKFIVSEMQKSQEEDIE